MKNHYSAVQYHESVTHYLTKEKSLGAIIGPISDCGGSPEHDLIHFSPLLTRPKDHNKRRVILELSYPKGQSLNDQVDRNLFDGLAFILKFPSVDDIVQEIVTHGDDVTLAKIDVARAFRNLHVDPADALKLGIIWGSDAYIDAAVAFGWVHGSAASQRVSDAVTFILAKKGIKLFAYIDDYILVSPKATADHHFDTLASLLSELGLPSNPEKQTPPCRALTCLGIRIDLDANTLSIDALKLQLIYEECLATTGKRHLTKKAFQSLLGKLLYIYKCVQPARTFINRMLSLFRQNAHNPRIPLTAEFHQDLNWFLKFLPKFNGVTYIHKASIPESQTLYIDASLTGLGGVWNGQVYATPIFDIYGIPLNIVHLEMLRFGHSPQVMGSRLGPLYSKVLL